MMMKNDFVLAADIGGTHITAAVIDMTLRQTIPLSLVRSPVDANSTADRIIASWSQCLLEAKSNMDVSKICIAIPGPFEYNKGISLMKGQGKYESLYQLNIKQLLSEALHTHPAQLFMENDAACFLQGEVFAGCVAGDYEKVIGVTLGTGLGTAVYKKGTCSSADLWSLPFGQGIAEDYLATRWFVQRYQQLSGKTVSGVKALADEANSNAIAQSIFHEFGKALAEFLQYFIEREQPEAVVIGGNIANAYELFQKEMEEAVINNFPSVKIKKSSLGEQSALFGAAGSWYIAMQKSLSFSQ
jgi:glucokinase